MSKGGKPILAMPSRTHRGTSRIVSNIKEGAGVVTTRFVESATSKCYVLFKFLSQLVLLFILILLIPRAHVHYIVTEHGIASCFGKTLNERCEQLIQIAHPDDRAGLYDDARKRGLTTYISFQSAALPGD